MVTDLHIRRLRRFDRAGMDAIFRFLDQINPFEEREISGDGQGQEPQSAVRGHPGWYLKAIFIGKHQVTMFIIWPFDRVDGLNVRQRSF